MEGIGNKLLVRELNNSLEDKNLSHAYLFSGPSGVGKKTLAKSFAMELLGAEGENHPDLYILHSQGSIKKEEVEFLIEESTKTPLLGGRKVFVIPDFDTVTEQGQNALLKTLEEPPKNFHLILTTSNIEMVLPTIVSRSRVLNFKPISNEEIEEFLLKKVEPSRAKIISRLSGGSLSRAEELLDENYMDLRKKTLKIFINLFDSSNFYPFKVYEFFEENKDNIFFILEAAYSYYSDIIRTRVGREIVNIDYRDEIIYEKIKINRTIKILEYIENTISSLKQNGNFRMSIELLMLNIREELDERSCRG